MTAKDKFCLFMKHLIFTDYHEPNEQPYVDETSEYDDFLILIIDQKVYINGTFQMFCWLLSTRNNWILQNTRGPGVANNKFNHAVWGDIKTIG